MHTGEMQKQVLLEHLLGYIEKCYIRAYRVAIPVGCPVLWWLGSHAGTVAHKRVVDVYIDRCAVALQLPVAWHSNLIPVAQVVVFSIEVCWTLLRITTPVEQPLSVKTHYLLTLFPLRRKLQRGVIWKFVYAQYRGIFPVVGCLCLRL